MEMKKRWGRLVDGIAALRRLLRQHRYSMATVGAGFDESELQTAWDECHDGLECVLAPKDDYALMLNRLKNARRYFLDGETWPAVWEVTQTLQRAKNLRRLYGYE